MPLEKWLTGGWRELPAWRIDLGGEQEQPLTIQWAGASEQLALGLSTSGWRRPPSLDLNSFLGMFSPDTPIEKLPVLPRLHDGRVDCLRLIHLDKGQRWVLRLWPAAVTIAGNNTALFIGTIEAQQRRHLTGLITTALDTGEYDRSMEMLKQALPDRFRTKPAIRAPDEIQVTRERRRLHWGGRGFAGLALIAARHLPGGRFVVMVAGPFGLSATGPAPPTRPGLATCHEPGGVVCDEIDPGA